MTRPAARLAVLALAATTVLAGCGEEEAKNPTGASSSAGQAACPPVERVDERVESFDEAPPMCIDESKTYTATMQTDVGQIIIELDAKKAPRTVNNFVVLSRYKFYDGVTFHRVIPGFMIQGGDPEGTGSGGPGYQFEDELPQAGEYEIGSIAMANAGPNTNGSQFFIVTGDAGVGLGPDYSLFGRVVEGLDVVTKIEKDGSDTGAPEETHTIESVAITEN